MGLDIVVAVVGVVGLEVGSAGLGLGIVEVVLEVACWVLELVLGAERIRFPLILGHPAVDIVDLLVRATVRRFCEGFYTSFFSF
jgi:hypothetical protein